MRSLTRIRSGETKGMRNLEMKRWLQLQGTYYVATGVTPLLSRRLFEALTGRKRDWWLVQTVGALVSFLGIGFLSAARRERITPEIAGLAVGCATALAVVDVANSGRGRNSHAYLLDAVAQGTFVAGWAISRVRA